MSKPESFKESFEKAFRDKNGDRPTFTGDDSYFWDEGYENATWAAKFAMKQLEDYYYGHQLLREEAVFHKIREMRRSLE